MSAFEDRPRATWQGPLLLPASFRWRDPETQLVHHGAVVQQHDGVIRGYTTLCTEVLGARWAGGPVGTKDTEMITCLECLGAREQDE